MPLYIDTNTPRPFIDPNIHDRSIWPEDASESPLAVLSKSGYSYPTSQNSSLDARDGAALPDHIYMDAMGFGMGCCCLQITFQACSVNEARRMYDAFVPVGPIMVSLARLFRVSLSR